MCCSAQCHLVLASRSVLHLGASVIGLLLIVVLFLLVLLVWFGFTCSFLRAYREHSVKHTQNTDRYPTPVLHVQFISHSLPLCWTASSNICLLPEGYWFWERFTVSVTRLTREANPHFLAPVIRGPACAWQDAPCRYNVMKNGRWNLK